MKNINDSLARMLLSGKTSKWLADRWWQKNDTTGSMVVGSEQMAIEARKFHTGIFWATTLLVMAVACLIGSILWVPTLYLASYLLAGTAVIIFLPGKKARKTHRQTKQFLEDMQGVYDQMENFVLDPSLPMAIEARRIETLEAISSEPKGREKIEQILVYLALEVRKREDEYGTTSDKATLARNMFTRAHARFNKFYNLVEKDHGFYFNKANALLREMKKEDSGGALLM